ESDMRTEKILPTGLSLTAFFLLIGLPLIEVLRRAAFAPALPESFLERLFSTIDFTARQAALSTLFAFLLGVPLGIFYARRWHPAIRGFATATFALPTIVAVGAVGLIL